MHGANGNDEDFLWTWLKYAKARLYAAERQIVRCHLVPLGCPSLLLMLEDMQTRYAIDPAVSCSPASDGGSFGYDVGFAFPERFAGLAVVAGILRPHQRSAQAAVCQSILRMAHGTSSFQCNLFVW